ncbi:MAG: gliding motility-associated C-terminal domain-containing protein [Saprospiraceae bacterium]
MQKLFFLLFLLLFSISLAGQTCSGSVGDNIFPDGDFGKGSANILQTDPQLAPGYRYQFNPPPDDGFYTITNNTTSWGSFAAVDWIDIKDNSNDPNGYMMVVNASFAPGLFYEKTVPVCGNTNYEFSADVISLNDPTKGSNFIPPNITFLINGVARFSSGNVPVDARWHTYGFTFTTDSAATEIKLAVRNNAPGGFGNDLALDNITFRPCGPTVILIDTAAFCTPNREINISSEVIGSAFATPVFQWQQSASGSSDWQDIPGKTLKDLNLSNPSDGQYFRLTVASSPANLAQNSCRIASNPTRVTYLPERDTIRRMICLGDTIQIANQLFFRAGSTNIPGKAVNGCDSVATVIIQVEDLSNFMIEGDPYLCKNDTAILHAGNYARYNWSTGAISPTITISKPGTYGATITSIHNCVGQDTIIINNAEITDFSIQTVPPLCANSQDARITISEVKGDLPPYLYAIKGQPLQNSNEFVNIPAGNYTLITQNSIGCTLEKTIHITAPPLFLIDLGEAPRLELGDTITLEVNSNEPIITYFWEPAARLSCADCPNPVAKPLQTTRFKLTATNANGCISSDSLQFFVAKVTHFYVPNAFSPNGDGVNDIFTFYPGKSVENIMEAQIFDRWGNLIYHIRDNLNVKWDGTFNQKMMPAGVYLWTATVKYIDGSVERFSGDILLVR